MSNRYRFSGHGSPLSSSSSSIPSNSLNIDRLLKRIDTASPARLRHVLKTAIVRCSLATAKDISVLLLQDVPITSNQTETLPSRQKDTPSPAGKGKERVIDVAESSFTWTEEQSWTTPSTSDESQVASQPPSGGKVRLEPSSQASIISHINSIAPLHGDKWPNALYDYVSRSFSEVHKIPGIGCVSVEKRLKNILKDAEERNALQDTNWDAHPLPQTLICAERLMAERKEENMHNEPSVQGQEASTPGESAAESSDGEERKSLKRKLDEDEGVAEGSAPISHYAICQRCEDTFDMNNNETMDCLYHPGKAKPDYNGFKGHDGEITAVIASAQFHEEYPDEDIHDSISSIKLRKAFPRKYKWTCCGGDGLAEGCTQGPHMERRVRARK